MNNAELIRRADLALSDLTNDGGLLNPEQANSFVRLLIKQPTILGAVRTVEMNADKRKINKIKFGSRVLRPTTSGTAFTSTERVKPTTSQVEVDTDEVQAEVFLPYDVIEDNIERGDIGQNVDGSGSQGVPANGGFVSTIQTLIAEAAARDLEELALEGNTTVSDEFLALQDGYLALLSANGNVVNASNATISRSIFRQGMQALPSQYLRNRAQMRHFVSVNKEIDYRETLATRATGLGDNTIEEFSPVFAYGVPVQPVELMPEDRGMFTDPRNMIFGIRRQMSMEYAKDISARVYQIVLTARIGFEVEDADAAVTYEAIADT